MNESDNDKNDLGEDQPTRNESNDGTSEAFKSAMEELDRIADEKRASADDAECPRFTATMLPSGVWAVYDGKRHCECDAPNGYPNRAAAIKAANELNLYVGKCYWGEPDNPSEAPLPDRPTPYIAY